jgi:hypothetical protein
MAAALAASSSWNFSMRLHVDGCASPAIYHPLNTGNAIIQGNTSTPSSSNIWVNFKLWREVVGPNQSFGTVSTPPKVNFALQFPTAISVSDTKYCLEIWRGTDDGITITGSGTLHN